MKGYPAISVAEQRAGGRGRGAAVQGKGEMGGAPAAGSHCHLPALISSGAWRFGLTWHREMQNSLLLPELNLSNSSLYYPLPAPSSFLCFAGAKGAGNGAAVEDDDEDVDGFSLI